jgi:chemotaxis protein methyltransferase CheR
MSSELSLSPQVFSILSALIEERLGLYFNSDYRDVVLEKLGPRALELGFESMLDYYYFLRYDAAADAELLAVADALTVNETYFLREATQLRVLVEDMLAPAVARGARPRVWCAACSTGEEPISLASLLDERGLLGRVDLLASDVSERALRVARGGVYGARAVRSFETLPHWLSRDGERNVVAPRLREAIDWRCINLLDAPAVAALGHFDAIICRNVMIYFRDETTQAVVARLHDALVPGGQLLIGASESLLRLGTAFVCEEQRGAFFYRRSVA